jgi:hypothetical protein
VDIEHRRTLDAERRAAAKVHQAGNIRLGCAADRELGQQPANLVLCGRRQPMEQRDVCAEAVALGR